MHTEPTHKQQDSKSSSTVDEIVAIAPLTEEWWLAASNQLRSGKQVISSEWELTKRALGAAVLLWTVIIAALGAFLVSINATAAYLLFAADIQPWIIAVGVLIVNLLFIAVCISTLKRVGNHINMKQTMAMFKGKNSLTDEDQAGEQKYE